MLLPPEQIELIDKIEYELKIARMTDKPIVIQTAVEEAYVLAVALLKTLQQQFPEKSV